MANPRLSPCVVAEARSTRAGARVEALARANGLFLSHFEHTAWLPLPEAWEPAGRPDLGDVAVWGAGVRGETKFRHFRLDRMVGSFHPGQRAKWTAHELAHKLVGWAWWPGMSALELATAARVAEVVPVALWYFFDEADRRRCPVHAEVDAWGGGCCRACEAAAAEGPGERVDVGAMEAGKRFVERELSAAEAVLATGRPTPTPWRSVDLSSDGFAWAAAHRPRLEHPAFARWVEDFVPEGHGRWRSIAELVRRVREVAQAVCGEGTLTPWSGGTRDWIVQDVSARVIQVRVDTDGEAAVGLDAALSRAATHRDVDGLVNDYVKLCEDWELPEPTDVFAVGYRFGASGFGMRPSDLGEAVESAVPHTVRMLGRAALELVDSAASLDDWSRLPLLRRLARVPPPMSAPIAALFALEVALADPPPVDLVALTLAADVDDASRLTLGSVVIVQAPPGWERALAGGALRRGALVTVAVATGADGRALAVELSPVAAAACVRMAVEPIRVLEVEPEERGALIASGIWVAARRAV